MDSSSKMNVKVQVKKPKKYALEELVALSKEELIKKVQALEAQNTQLKHIISRSLDTKKVGRKNLKPFDFARCTYRHVLLKFYYLGWDYRGYASQEDTINTIEHYLFDALIKTCLIKDRASSNYHRCGRTDKGVSSFGQVISIDLRSKLKTEDQHKLVDEIEYCKLLNKVLPEGIQCVGWTPVKDDFSSRFDCKSRTYKYFFPKGTLDIAKMRTASSYLLGSNDFRNFCKMDIGNGVVEFTRNMHSIEFSCTHASKERREDDPYSMYVATIKGQSFLWHQIRCIMGVLFLIGENRESPEVILELLDVEKNPRKPEYNMASEVPLNLYQCQYELENEWFYSRESLDTVLNKLKTIWGFHSVKTAMMKTMIDDLEILLNSSTDTSDAIKNGTCKTSEASTSMSDALLNGVKARTYVPLLERKRCESLESRIEHYVKRSRLEIVHNTKEIK